MRAGKAKVKTKPLLSQSITAFLEERQIFKKNRTPQYKCLFNRKNEKLVTLIVIKL
jgi:hypothetical protein